MEKFRYAHVIDGKVDNVIVATEKGFASIMSTTLNSVGMWVKETSETKRARVGCNYHIAKRKFYDNQPFPSWLFSEELVDWVAPKPQPGPNFNWNEELNDWKEFVVNCPDCEI